MSQISPCSTKMHQPHGAHQAPAKYDLESKFQINTQSSRASSGRFVIHRTTQSHEITTSSRTHAAKDCKNDTFLTRRPTTIYQGKGNLVFIQISANLRVLTIGRSRTKHPDERSLCESSRLPDNSPVSAACEPFSSFVLGQMSYCVSIFYFSKRRMPLP